MPVETLPKLAQETLPRFPYERPLVIKIRGMSFPQEIISGGKTIVCKQCSSCHACR